jgi:3-methylfumaryl-CoA hydratase
MTLAHGQNETVSLAQARRVAAMLDIDPQSLSPHDPLPRGWHFALLAGETPRRALRTDGFPGLGVPMPLLDRPRLLLGARKMTFHGDLTIDAPVLRYSGITSVVEKTGRNGPLSIVTLDHVLTPYGAATAAVTDQQTYYLAGLPQPGAPAATKTPLLDLPPGPSTVVTPDGVMLFQYSALGFNTHRIHFDRDYARDIEGHPDLVVNGGLATLLATEFLRRDLGRHLTSIAARHLAALYVNRPMTLRWQPVALGLGNLFLLDDSGVLAVELAVTFDEL